MAKESLGVNNNVSDALFQSVFEGLADSQWGYRSFKTRPDFTRQKIVINPKSGSTTPSYNSTQQFEIPKRAAILRRLSVRWRAASLGATGSATDPRFVDYVGFALLERSLLRYASNEIHRIEPLELYITNRLDHRRKDQEAVARLAGGDLSAGQRATLAGAPQNFTVHLPFHFSELPDKCVFLEALGHPLEVDIKLRDFSDVVDADSAGSPSEVNGGAISNFRLEAEIIHIEDYERDYHVQRTLDDTGLIMSVREHNYQPRVTVPTAVQDFTYRLTNLKHSCYEIRWVLTRNAETDGQVTGSKDYFNFYDFSLPPFGLASAAGDENWRLDASGIEIISPIDSQWNIEVENRDLHSGDSGDAIYGQAFGFHPEDRRNCTGHKTWAGMTNPAIIYRFNTNTPAGYSVQAISREYNALHSIQGDLVKIFK